MDVGIDLVLGKVGFRPVKDPSLIGTGRNTVSAPDAPIIVNDNNPVRFLPGGMDRANLHAGRILALLTLDRQIDKPFFRNGFRGVVMFRVFQIDQVSSLQSEDSDPVELAGITGLIIFLDTGVDASSTPNASRELQTISPKGLGKGLLRADLKFPAVLLKVSSFHLSDDLLLFVFVHLEVVFLKEIFYFFSRARGEKRKSEAGQSGYGKIADEFPASVVFIWHFFCPWAGRVGVPVSSS